MKKGHQKAKASKESPEAREIPLVWAPTEGLETIYANHLLVTHMGGEFYLVFGELPMPITFSPKEELPESLRVIPKVRLAISPAAMKLMAQAIENNMQTYEDNQ